MKLWVTLPCCARATSKIDARNTAALGSTERSSALRFEGGVQSGKHDAFGNSTKAVMVEATPSVMIGASSSHRIL